MVMCVAAKHLRASWVIVTERMVSIVFIDDHKLGIHLEPELTASILNFIHKTSSILENIG